MRRSDATVLSVAAIFGLTVTVLAVRQGRHKAEPAAVATPPVADSVVTLQTQEGDLVTVRRSSLAPPGPRNYATIASDLAAGRDVTYMDDILAVRHGNVARWVDRRNDPIRVWIDTAPAARDFWPEYPARVRDAFYTWSSAGIPLRFLFVTDSAAAEVHVRWVDHFTDTAAGKTYWVRDVHWWILGADIEIALHSAAGKTYDREAVHAIALHEIGHVIGLDHSPHTDDIMAPRIHAMRLSSGDLRTAHLIYRLPPGPTRDTTVAR